jgi:anti-sigma regulatory factor (Ser/Thr protein kinase)
VKGGTSPNGAVELLVPPRSEYLQLVRAIVGATAALEDGLHSGRVADLRLVASEAVANAIVAQGSILAADPILVRCELAGDRIVVEVTDHGPGFDLTAVPELPEVETPERLRHESGLGVSLMHRLSDTAEVESGPGGTLVRLVIAVGNA